MSPRRCPEPILRGEPISVPRLRTVRAQAWPKRAVDRAGIGCRPLAGRRAVAYRRALAGRIAGTGDGSTPNFARNGRTGRCRCRFPGCTGDKRAVSTNPQIPSACCNAMVPKPPAAIRHDFCRLAATRTVGSASRVPRLTAPHRSRCDAVILLAVGAPADRGGLASIRP